MPAAARCRRPEHHLPDSDPRGPLISPLFAPDLSGLPSALVITADGDIFRDDGRRYARRLAEAGVPVRATNYLGAAHGFLDARRLARCWSQAMSEIVQEATRALATPAPRVDTGPPDHHGR